MTSADGPERYHAALTALEQRAAAAVDADETVELLRELIRCPSENPPGNEGPCAELLAEFLSERDIATRLVEVAEGRSNLYAQHGPGDRTLVLNGHLDTVPVGEGWTVEPFAAVVRDDRVYGRGACDMKGGIAAMCAAMLALKRAELPLNGRMVLHMVVDEESVALGTRKAIEEPADWVVVTEPSRGQVIASGNGQLNYEIVFEGKAVHSSVPEEGRNAIHDAAAFIALIETENRRFAQSPYPGIGPATYSTGLIDGGLGGTTVPDRCSLTLDRRVLPTESLDGAEKQVVSLLESLALERPGLRWSMRRTLEFPTMPDTRSRELAATVQSVVADLGGPAPTGLGMRAATDAAWYCEAGRPVVIFGPGDGETAHRPDEFISINDLLFGARALAVASVRLLADQHLAGG